MTPPGTAPKPLPTLGSETLSLDLELERHAERFVARFGAGPAPRLFFAPGRVNLFGGHLDYNGGPVMPTAIDRGTFVALRPRADRVVRFASTFDVQTFEAALDALPPERTGSWADYPLGVLHALASQASPTGHDLAGVDVLFGGNLPVGAGLSSSASICVGTAYAFDRAFGLGLDVRARIAAALEAERGFVGVQCGIMDPFAVGFAKPDHLLWLDCKDESIAHLPVDFERLSIGVVDTGVQRQLARGEFNRRVAECARAFELLAPHQPGAICLRDVEPATLESHASSLEPTVLRRARHVLSEVERTFAARAALEAGDFTRLGALMTATHRSFQSDYECSCDELDTVVDTAVAQAGCLGARLTGAGFGGCAVLLVEPGAEQDVVAAVQAAFEARHGSTPTADFFRGDEGPRDAR